MAEGDPIPTLHALAKKYDVAVGTAQRAVAHLVAAGYVTSHSGRRTTVAVPPSGT